MDGDKARVVGFTGTRDGMKYQQRKSFEKLLRLIREESGYSLIGLHGDCVGADEDFELGCRVLGIQSKCRPCTFDGLRAHTSSEVIADPVPPMQRNRAIVESADVMIACPPNYVTITRGSGTWATIGFAEKAKVELYIIYPDGTINRNTGKGREPYEVVL